MFLFVRPPVVLGRLTRGFVPGQMSLLSMLLRYQVRVRRSVF